jgi:hypothetical protein
MPRAPLAEWSKHRAQYMAEAMNLIFLKAEGHALEAGQPFSEAVEVGLETGCECIAAQVNVLVHYYGQVRLKADPEVYGGSSHYDFMAELLENVSRRALGRHLTPCERGLA